MSSSHAETVSLDIAVFGIGSGVLVTGTSMLDDGDGAMDTLGEMLSSTVGVGDAEGEIVGVGEASILHAPK